MSSESEVKSAVPLLFERDIKYRVTLEGTAGSIIPWPSIATPRAKFVGEELGRVLQPADAEALKKFFEEHYSRIKTEAGFVPHHAYYNIFKDNDIANIDDMYKRARPFVHRITDPWYGRTDGYSYIDDKQNRKIETDKPSDPEDFKPEAGARAGDGAGAELGGSRRSSRKYKKSNRVYRKKSRATKRN